MGSDTKISTSISMVQRVATGQVTNKNDTGQPMTLDKMSNFNQSFQQGTR